MFDRQKMERWWKRTVSADRVGVFSGIARGGLWLGTIPVEGVTRLRNLFYDTGVLPALKPPVPVISFGNLTVGGTGKTPAVIWCARYLLERGMKPGIASRGYNPEAADAGVANDEARLLSEALPGVPHVWNADRAAAAAALVKEHDCNLVILDDGFQHRRIHRTVDFLLVDALNPWGHGYMMPRGLLREPVSSLRRASCVIITHSNLVGSDELIRIRRRIWEIEEAVKLAEAVHRPESLVVDGETREPESLKGMRVFAMCGIGSPYSFVTTLGHLGAEVVGIRSFADHHIYTDEEINGVFAEAAARRAQLVVTTQKDRVKIGAREAVKVPLAELRIDFDIIRGRGTVTNILDFLSGSAEGSGA